MTQQSEHVVFSGAYARAICVNPGAKRLLVTLDNWRRHRNGFPDRRVSRTAEQAGFAQIWVQSSRNDWYLSPELPALRTALDEFCGQFRAVHGIGYSMGGYGALLLSRALHLHKAVLISPQFSIFPARASYESRYRVFAAALDPALDTLAQDISPALQGVILFDPGPATNDRLHAREIAALAPGLKPLALPFSGHPASQIISSGGLIGKVMQMAISGKISAARARAIQHAARKTSGVYQTALQDYLDRRALRGQGVDSGQDEVIR